MLRPWAATNTTTSKSYNRSKQKGARETERLFFGLTFALLSRQRGGPGVSLASTEDLRRPGSSIGSGAALFDLLSPERCLRLGQEWIVVRSTPIRDLATLPTSCSRAALPLTPTAIQSTLTGGADSRIALATGNVSMLLRWLKT